MVGAEFLGLLLYVLLLDLLEKGVVRIEEPGIVLPGEAAPDAALDDLSVRPEFRQPLG